MQWHQVDWQVNTHRGQCPTKYLKFFSCSAHLKAGSQRVYCSLLTMPGIGPYKTGIAMVRTICLPNVTTCYQTSQASPHPAYLHTASYQILDVGTVWKRYTSIISRPPCFCFSLCADNNTRKQKSGKNRNGLGEFIMWTSGGCRRGRAQPLVSLNTVKWTCLPSLLIPTSVHCAVKFSDCGVRNWF